MIKYSLLVQLIILSVIPRTLVAQEQLFSLENCINYAWENSTNIGRASNSVKMQNAYLVQSKAALGPNLSLNSSETLHSSKSYNETANKWSTNSGSNLSTSLNAEITVYNGAKLKNTIAQGKINLAASESDIQTQKEQISLSVLSAYINVLLAKENVKNFESQLDDTEQQVVFAEARKKAGVLSPADYLNIKSQYATDKAALVDANNSLRLNFVTLMQLLNMPVNSSFDIMDPKVNVLLENKYETDAEVVYNTALGIQPSIKSGELYLESTHMDIKIARADALPQLSLQGSVSSGYNSSLNNVGFSNQISNQIAPSIGLSLSIPLYQRKKVKTNVAIAKLQSENQGLELLDLKISLRKYIEQACMDLQTSRSNYVARLEQYDAEKESYQVSQEMFAQGMINSVDFLTSKNNLVTAENSLTQAKYNVLLQRKIIDYYMGNSILF